MYVIQGEDGTHARPTSTYYTVTSETPAPLQCWSLSISEISTADTQQLTQARCDPLKEELRKCIEVKRPEITKFIDAARQEGDLRENGGYYAVRNEQLMDEARIQTLQEIPEHAKVGRTPADDGVVEPGTVVTATVAGREQTFLLDSRDAGGDLGAQVLSTRAPLGVAIIGYRPGDKLSYEVPNGRVIEVEIIEAKPFVD